MIELITALIAFLPMWLLQNCIHELTHGLAMKIGWKYSFNIYPFPSRKLGRFTWAHVKYHKTEKSREISEQDRGFVAILPKMINMFFIVLGCFLLMLSSGFKILSTLLIMFVFYNFVDFFAGLLSAFKSEPVRTDLWRFQSSFNISITLLRGLVISHYIVFGFLTAVSLFVYFARLV